METVNQENANQEVKEATTEEVKFTQADLDKVVQDRLAREREKYKDYDALKEKASKYDEIEEASKTELQKATERAKSLEEELNSLKKANTIKAIREKVAKDTGVPANLLTADSEEACKEQAESILEFSRPSGYPAVKDAGEARATGKRSTRDSFAAWFNAQ